MQPGGDKEEERGGEEEGAHSRCIDQCCVTVRARWALEIEYVIDSCLFMLLLLLYISEIVADVGKRRREIQVE